MILKNNLKLSILVLLFIFLSCNNEKSKIIKSISKCLENTNVLKTRLNDDLTNNEFKICYSDCFSKEIKELIYKYEKQWYESDSNNSSYKKKTFSEIYTFNSNLWNGTDVIYDEIPSALLEYVTISNKHIILGIRHGGFVESRFFKVYLLVENKINDHWIIHRDNVSISKTIEQVNCEEIKLYK